MWKIKFLVSALKGIMGRQTGKRLQKNYNILLEMLRYGGKNRVIHENKRKGSHDLYLGDGLPGGCIAKANG